MDKKNIIKIVAAVVIAGLGYFLKEDVKGIVCEAPAQASTVK